MLRSSRRAGFGLVELLIVMAAVLVVCGIALPSIENTLGALRGTWASRSLSAELYLARMRANAKFTKTRVRVDPSQKTFQLEVFDKTSNTFQTEGGTQYLDKRISLGYGSITTPAGSQTTIEQSTAVTFNSRGIPITDSGIPTGVYALYLNDSSHFYAVTVSIVGQVETWKWSGTGWQQL